MGIGSRGQRDATYGLYSLDAHAPREHKVPEHEGGTKPSGWFRCASRAVGGEEGAVWLHACVEGTDVWSLWRSRGLGSFREAGPMEWSVSGHRGR